MTDQLGRDLRYAVRQLIRSPGFQPNDPVILVAISCLLAAVALAACLLPARRAMQVDPAGTLRTE